MEVSLAKKREQFKPLFISLSTVILLYFKQEVHMKILYLILIILIACLFIYNVLQSVFSSIFGNKKLKKQLKQQELMTAISQSFTTNKSPNVLIYEALEKCGEFMNVNHVFLSIYQNEKNTLENLHEWKNTKEQWPFAKISNYYQDMISFGYKAVNDYKDKNQNNRMSFLLVSLNISGKFRGVLGFVIYGIPHKWELNEIHLGRQISGILSNVINKNSINEELIKAKEQAERAGKIKCQFLSKMSQEMRTPVNTIIGMTGYGKNTIDTERKNYSFGIIEDASNKLINIINDVMDMSEIKSNNFKLSFSGFNPEKMINYIVNIFNNQIKTKKQHFTVLIANDLPKVIYSDEQRLSQVLVNLLENALKFTPDEGSISLFARKLEQNNRFVKLQFEIRDSGIGITEEQKKRLFNPFDPEESLMTGKLGGTGLGLSISKSIIEMMNGKITVNSIFGKGSSFIFDIYAEAPEEINCCMSAVMNRKLASA